MLCASDFGSSRFLFLLRLYAPICLTQTTRSKMFLVCVDGDAYAFRHSPMGIPSENIEYRGLMTELITGGIGPCRRRGACQLFASVTALHPGAHT